ncbi:hypothetical protein Acr_26g0005000 [Actinidia rufa]|uniref:Uncharacterized protein n=1 Tax=Actinidia rufa TaxID=165716 RepID=A0A7J0H2B2_9ERIC|nr:hypothetical protein Acr_26g0005000 [Actinidia rufa]
MLCAPDFGKEAASILDSSAAFFDRSFWVPEESEFDRKAFSEFSRRSGFIREHDEMSAHGLWTKLKEMYREKTSQNKVLLRRLVLKLQRGTIVAEQTSEFQRATGRGQKKRPEKRSQEGGHRGQEKRRDKKNCPRNKAQDQSSEAATTTMMAVDESDVLLAASADEERSCRRRKTGRLYRLRENVQTGELLSDIGPVVLARWMDEEATVAQRHAKQAQEYLMDVLEGSTVEQERKDMLWDTCGSLARHEKVQPLQDVHEEAQRRETESMHNDRRDVAEMSLFRSRSVAVISPIVHTREEEERWSHDDLQSDVLCRAPRDKVSDSCAEKMGKEERDALIEAVRGAERKEAPSSIVKNGAGHTAECCVQRGWERGVCYGALRAQRAERVVCYVTGDYSLGTTIPSALRCPPTRFPAAMGDSLSRHHANAQPEVLCSANQRNLKAPKAVLEELPLLRFKKWKASILITTKGKRKAGFQLAGCSTEDLSGETGSSSSAGLSETIGLTRKRAEDPRRSLSSDPFQLRLESICEK